MMQQPKIDTESHFDRYHLILLTKRDLYTTKRDLDTTKKDLYATKRNLYTQLKEICIQLKEICIHNCKATVQSLCVVL